jgi:hypothetical protein
MLKRPLIIVMAVLIGGALMGAECAGGDKVCDTLGATCTDEKPNPGDAKENAPDAGREPHPHKADPNPPQTKASVPVTFTCTWLARRWIEFTVIIDGNAQPTKEKKYQDSSGGTYEETHEVNKGANVELVCKIMEDDSREYPTTLNCTIKAFGNILQGGGYQRANGRVRCFAKV